MSTSAESVARRVMELIGLSPMGTAAVPQVDPRKDDVAFSCGRIILDMVQQDRKPRDIATRKAFENAIAGVAATGVASARSALAGAGAGAGAARTAAAARGVGGTAAAIAGLGVGTCAAWTGAAAGSDFSRSSQAPAIATMATTATAPVPIRRRDDRLAALGLGAAAMTGVFPSLVRR